MHESMSVVSDVGRCDNVDDVQYRTTAVSVTVGSLFINIDGRWTVTIVCHVRTFYKKNFSSAN